MRFCAAMRGSMVSLMALMASVLLSDCRRELGRSVSASISLMLLCAAAMCEWVVASIAFVLTVMVFRASVLLSRSTL
eukprot:1408008-Pyramimonas_sp.AAC.1